jgi:hypothetical protein
MTRPSASATVILDVPLSFLISTLIEISEFSLVYEPLNLPCWFIIVWREGTVVRDHTGALGGAGRTDPFLLRFT